MKDPEFTYAGFFKETTINDRWLVKLPVHRAILDWWPGGWEKVRFDSMDKNLRPGDILADIGAEQGDISAVYAMMADRQVRMVLMESCPDVWPNIRKTFEVNNLADPVGCFVGLLSDETIDKPADFDSTLRGSWPECAWHDHLWFLTSFRYIHRQSSTPQIRLDDWIDQSGVMPTVLTIDVEGAEFKVLKGANRLLCSENAPLVYVSIHPDLIERDYEGTAKDLIGFMRSCGYCANLLGTDHEEHWAFWNPSRPLR